MRASATRLLHTHNYLRGPQQVDKEWFHVLVWQGERMALVNLAMLRDAAGRPEGRVTVLLRDAEGWSGGSWRSPWRPQRCPPGRVGIQLAGARLQQRRDGVIVQATLGRPELELELELALAWPPAPPARTALGGGRYMTWTAAPCCVANGSINSPRGRWRLRDAIAYHDHNWGRFGWGARIGWTWAVASWRERGAPGAAVYSAIGARGGGGARQRVLLLWSGEPTPSVFTGAEVEERRRGQLRPRALLRVPPVAALAVPGTATGVPARLELAAASRGTSATMILEPRDQSQLVVPDDDDPLGYTLINEVHATSTVHVNGQRRASCPAMLEVVQGG